MRFLTLLALLTNCLWGTEYLSQEQKTQEQAQGYTKTSVSLARYLGYRDLPGLFEKYVTGKRTLDYGCGTGISTQFLMEQKFDVMGVDISDEMLALASTNYPTVHFQKCGEQTFDNEFDLVFSSVVLFELESPEAITRYLQEGKNALKDDGVFIAVTGSQYMYSQNWFIFDNDFPENKMLKSGNLVKVHLKDAGITFTDFYWTEADYRKCFDAAGLELIEVHYPLGKANEPFDWQDERFYSPFVVFVAKKR